MNNLGSGKNPKSCAANLNGQMGRREQWEKTTRVELSRLASPSASLSARARVWQYVRPWAISALE